MKTNEELQRDVQQAIKWEPLLNPAEIGVTAKDGIVTLTGTVDSYWKKTEAEQAAKNVAGVKAVVEKIEIKFANTSFGKDDSQIAAAVLNAYEWNVEVPNDKVKIKVEKGWVTLDGELNWNFQKEAAGTAVRYLSGVVGLTNNLTIAGHAEIGIDLKEIESALERNWSLSDRQIKVKVAGTKITLTGKVDSWYQKTEAARIAWKARGVTSVDNELVVDYAFELAD